MKNFSTKLLALVLSFLMCLYLFPTSVIAEALTDETEHEATEGTAAESVKTENVFEVTELREESVKHFRLSDGTYVAAQYNTPVHYLDDDGKWQDIDNTLTDSGSGITTSDAKIKFAKHIPGNEVLCTLQKDNYKIEMSLNGAIKKTSGVATNTVTEFDESATVLQKKMTLDKLTARVMYADILDGVDLEYVLNSGNIKENIIVKEKAEEYAYTFTLKLNNLTATLDDSGDIVITKADGEAVYRIPAPIVYDASGVYAEDEMSAYTLTNNGSGKYSLTVSVNSQWMNAEERVFPVTVDPTIEKGSHPTEIVDAFISSSNPDTNYNIGYSRLLCGCSSDKGVTRLLTKLSVLPDLPKGSVIIDAKYSMYQFSFSNYYGNDNPIYLSAHMITEDWEATGTTWNNQPAFNSEVLDYVILNSNNVGTYSTWDITKVAKTWYDNQDEKFGIIIKTDKEYPEENSEYSYCRFNSSDNESTSLVPSYCITYFNEIGIRDDMSYQNLDVGEAGLSYLNDYSLQMTVIKDLFESSWDNSLFMPSVMYSSQKEAPWSFSWEAFVTAFDDGYVFTDADGTEYYYTIDEDGTIIADEENDGEYTLSVLSSFENDSPFVSYGLDASKCIIVTSPYGISTVFYNGRPLLMAEEEAEEMQIVEFRYSTNSESWLPTEENNIVGIYVNSGTSATQLIGVIHNENEKTVTRYLDGVAKDSFKLTYSGDLITDIKYGEDSENFELIASYSYITDTNYISEIIDIKEDIGYLFNVCGSGVRTRYSFISGYMDISADAPKKLGEYTITFIENEHTVYRDTNLTEDAADDLFTKYVFGADATVVSEYTYDVNGKIFASSNTTYNTVVAEDGTTTRSEIYSEAISPALNMLRQNSFEANNSTYWHYSTGSTALSITGDNKRTGEKSLVYDSETAVNVYTYQSKSLKAGTNYVFSAYVYIDESALISANGGVLLEIIGGDNYSTKGYRLSVGKGQWQRISLPFVVDANGIYNTVISFSGISGKVYIDDTQLELGKAPSNFNYISNSAYNENANGWSVGEETSHSVESVVFPTEGTGSVTAIKLSGNLRKTNVITTNIPLGNSKTYVLSGFAKASSVYIGDSESNRTFAIIAEIVYTDGTTEEVKCSFDSFVDEWQYASTEIIPKEDGVIASVNVSMSYNYNYGAAYFTGVTLTEEAVYVYTESDESTEEDTEDDTTEADPTVTTYTLSGLLTELGFTSSMSFYFDADETYTIEDVTDDDGIITERYVYNSNEECVATLTVRGSEKIITSTITEDTTDSDGNVTGYKVTSYDEYGNYTVSVYNTEDQLITSTDALGNVTSYTYDNEETGGTYDEMRSGSTWVRYHYNANGELINITAESSQTTKKDKYIFTYSDLGLITGVYMGTLSTPIVTYTYSDSFMLTEMTYANGYSVSYEYDYLDRLEKICYNNVETYEYSYYLDGNTYRVANLVTGEVVEYIYENGVLSHELSFNDITLKKAVYVKLDSEGTQVGTDLHFRGENNAWCQNSSTETYDEDGTLTGITTSFGANLSFAYDSFDRIGSQTVGSLIRTRNYKTADENRTGELVSSIVYKTSNGSEAAKFSYTYDAKGNITAIYRDGDLVTSYVYDSLGQLYRENSVLENASYMYTYDGLGNILRKYTYAYSAGALGEVINEVRYSYTDGTWGDALTKYFPSYSTDITDHTEYTITYDDLKNPLSYYNGNRYTFTWNGRQLASAVLNGTTSSYVYDADGLRTKKTVGTIVYDYYWNNGKLYGMTITNGTEVDELMFAYDSEGTAFAMSYNENVYYYLTDIQGNVNGLIDENGNIVAEYAYDVWGKPISATATTETHAKAMTANPIRYRGYTYDSDTGLYYLQSRYYDPMIGRWLNSDEAFTLFFTPENILQYNLFAYCWNTPINFVDKEGVWPTANVTKTKNFFSIDLKIPWSDVELYFKTREVFMEIVAIISILIPEPTVSKVLGVSCGLEKIVSGLIAEVISSKKSGKTIKIGISFNYEIIVKYRILYTVGFGRWRMIVTQKYKSARIYNLKGWVNL